jgi:hypothetical protein
LTSKLPSITHVQQLQKYKHYVKCSLFVVSHESASSFRPLQGIFILVALNIFGFDACQSCEDVRSNGSHKLSCWNSNQTLPAP